MGTSNFAVPILKSLYQNGYPISVVYTQPPKKSNRGQKLNKSPINLFSENISLDIRTPEFLKNNKEEEVYLSKLQPDIIIVVSYGQIIPKNLLTIPKNGFLNVAPDIFHSKTQIKSGFLEYECKKLLLDFFAKKR